MYEHKNLGRQGQQLAASVNAQNLLAPGDELGFRVDFKHPYVFGSADTKKTALALSAFNVRKISGVFIPGAPVQDLQHPPLCSCETLISTALLQRKGQTRLA